MNFMELCFSLRFFSGSGLERVHEGLVVLLSLCALSDLFNCNLARLISGPPDCWRQREGGGEPADSWIELKFLWCHTYSLLWESLRATWGVKAMDHYLLSVERWGDWDNQGLPGRPRTQWVSIPGLFLSLYTLTTWWTAPVPGHWPEQLTGWISSGRHRCFSFKLRLMEDMNHGAAAGLPSVTLGTLHFVLLQRCTGWFLCFRSSSDQTQTGSKVHAEVSSCWDLTGDGGGDGLFVVDKAPTFCFIDAKIWNKGAKNVMLKKPGEKTSDHYLPVLVPFLLAGCYFLIKMMSTLYAL